MLTLESVLDQRSKVESAYWTDFWTVLCLVVIITVLVLFLWIFYRLESSFDLGNTIFVGIYTVGFAILFIYSMHGIFLYRHESYQEWQENFVKPYIMAQEEKYDIIRWEIIGTGSDGSSYSDNKTVGDGPYSLVRAVLNQNGEVVTYNFRAKVFIQEDREIKPYIIIHKLDSDLDRKYQAGIYDVELYTSEL